MKLTVLILLFVCVVVVELSQNNIPWARRANVWRHWEFFSNVVQETVYELERRGFSSLTLSNITQIVNLPMYKWHVNGTANYTNGFLVSVQRIDVTGMTQAVALPTIDGVRTPRATVSGRLNFWDPKLGYDVTFFEVNGAVHKFTGDYTHSLIDWHISIHKNLISNEVTVVLSSQTSGNLNRMVYRPATNLTEVISRDYRPFDNSAGVDTWSTILEPIILDIVKNKFPFPEVCFNHCG